ncbi:MAG: hypothetical protein LQ337_002803 [Flavoplaca oasis]|nr:MAG: hypothetical protein LQ337_002803 [Flavoplaca oasis]
MDPGTGGDIYLFYQWYDGGLRYISQSPLRVWQGSTHLDVPDAKLGTPLAAISTKSDGSTFWWLFYVDKADTVQNIYSESDTTGWRKGNVGDNGYKVPNATSIAFTALSGLRFNEDSKSLDGGLSLFISISTSTIQEYIFDEQGGKWSRGSTFPETDGLSGASVWALGFTAWMMTASETGSIILWSKQYSRVADKDAEQWVRGATSSADLMQKGGMCGQFHAGFRISSGYIQGSAFSVLENGPGPRWDKPYNISDQAAINETAVSCRWLSTMREADRDIYFQFFYQTDGSEIDEAVRLWGPDNQTYPGIWTYASIPV